MKDDQIIQWISQHDVQSIHVETSYDGDPGRLVMRDSAGATVEPPSLEQNVGHCFAVLRRRGMLVQAELDQNIRRAHAAALRDVEFYEENGPNFMVSRALDVLDQFHVYRAWAVGPEVPLNQRRLFRARRAANVCSMIQRWGRCHWCLPAHVERSIAAGC